MQKRTKSETIIRVSSRGRGPAFGWHLCWIEEKSQINEAECARAFADGVPVLLTSSPGGSGIRASNS